MDLARYLDGRRRLVERALARAFPATRATLRQAIRYSLLAGGKRVRPILTLAAGEVVGAAPRTTMPFACALELIHTYSLVHDDLPAMDDDDLRRGRPTSHAVYGEGTAILVGDALLTEAFGVMARARGVAPKRTLAAIDEAARAAGELGMVGGQALDLAAEGTSPTLATVRGIHARKTGALIRAAVRVGGIVGGAPPATLRRLTRYGEQLGLAFQIADDILDALEDGDADGRTDRELGKATYPGTLGMDGARRHAHRARDAATAALAPFGRRAEPLAALAAYVVERADVAAERAARA
ncbi:MAG TPA: farnesyl diphosphate synthase [Candidatus Eisenbacteria bacterium]|nr:farnesyl diphosphate synthase [Candidatus Eisenbacteria bacterium]